MADDTALNAEAHERLAKIGQADILVGIPSFNNAHTIGHVACAAAHGMRQYFPGLRAVLINTDGGSTDGTAQAVLKAPVPPGVEVLSTPYLGPSGKGSALRAVFEAAVLLDVSVCVVVDSDLRSITPEWISLLGEPVLRHSYGYVAPYYVRHKYDGTITNNIAYPMTSALYGQRVRQPIGGDFGFSGALARAFLAQDVWESDVARFGIDLFMTTTALASGQPVAQANLGAKVHDPKDPAASLGPMFQHVVGTLFALMGRYEHQWCSVVGSEPVPRLGPPLEVEPEPVEVNLEALVTRFRQGFRAHQATLEGVLEAETYRAMAWLAERGHAHYFQFPAEAWAQACYDVALAYHRLEVGGWRSDPTSNLQPPTPSLQEVIAALTPLYFGRTAGLVWETQTMDVADFEAYVDRQAHVFETLKPYLSGQWSVASGQ